MSYPVEWSVSGVDGKIVSVSGSLVSRGEDRVTIVCAGPLAVPASAGSEVSVAAAGWIWSGVVRTSRSVGTGAEKVTVHDCRGLYYKLAEHTYTQMRKFADPETGDLYESASGFVTLFQKDDGTHMTADEFLAEAFDQAGITLEECSTGLVLPMCDERGITLKGILERILTLAPKCAAWFDAAGKFHVAPGPVVSLSSLLDYDIGQRADLGVRGVRIEIQKTNEVTADGITETKLIQEIQSAGATSGPGVCYIPLQADGARLTSSHVSQSVDVETEDIPDDLTSDKAWWISHVADLSAVAAADLTIHFADGKTDTVPPLVIPTALKRIAVSSIPDAIGRNTAQVKFTADVSYKTRDAAGAVAEEFSHAQISFTALATDANTRSYVVSSGNDSSAETGEMFPPGIAASLFSAWSETFAEGSLGFHAGYLDAVQVGGKITAQGVTGYIQSIMFDSQTNRCQARVAPPDQSGLQSMAVLQAGMKSLSGGATSFGVRHDADPAPASNPIAAGAKVPPSNSGSTPGVTKVETQHDGSTTPSVKVVRDIADITDADTEMKYRKLILPVASAGGQVCTSVWALAAAPAADATLTETDITLFCKEFKLTGKLLSKTVGEADVFFGIRITGKSNYTSDDKRLLLQVTEPSTGTFTLDLDKGYLKS